MTVQLFLQPYLDQGLVGNITGIGGDLDGVQQVLGQPQRNRLGCGLEVWQGNFAGF